MAEDEHEPLVPPGVDPRRGVYCIRTLNLHAIRAIGYDMDYTLIHYHVTEWERHAYGYLAEGLRAKGWPVEGLVFDPSLVTRGLIVDLELGNVVKADRFGYVKRACHGRRTLEYAEQRSAYSRTRIDLREPRWVFLNTFFSISEGCMYVQLVEALDAGKLPHHLGYRELYEIVRSTLDQAHLEGRLKEEIIAAPERFIEPDPATPLALLDQKEAGKQLLLITNSEWGYAEPMMAFAFDRYLPAGMTWRDLFEIVLVGARKPSFFSQGAPAFELASDDGLLREARGNLRRGIYVGGNAALVEQSLGLEGEEILYVGDHLFVDVNVSKSVLRWRTALILRELEDEIAAAEAFAATQTELSALMAQKAKLEWSLWQERQQMQHERHGRGEAGAKEPELRARIDRVRSQLAALDERIAPMAQAANELLNPRWGLLMRAGNDKSHLARQVERYADVYTSRVGNLLAYTPFAYFRSPWGSLPHAPR